MLSVIPFLGKALDSIFGVVDQLVVDQDEKLRLKAQIQQQLLVQDAHLIEQFLNSQVQVLVAEAQSSHGLAAQWRPMLMFVFMAILVNNWILAPYLGAMFGTKIVLEIPASMWDLMTLGVGGYVGGRTFEKLMDTWATMKKAP